MPSLNFRSCCHIYDVAIDLELNICFINLLLPTSDVIITLKIVLMLHVISLLRFPSKAVFTTAVRQTSQNRLYKMEAVRQDLISLSSFSFIWSSKV